MLRIWKPMFGYVSAIAVNRLSREPHSILQMEELEQRYLLSTFTVVNTDDSGAGSFCAAIIDANSAPGLDTIEFSIGTGGHQVIQPLSPLPEITDSVVIDAMTQPGYDGQPLIELDGSQAGSEAHGLFITAGDSTVLGLVINRFGGSGILLENGGNNQISGNYVGTDWTGTSALGNGNQGIIVNNSDGNVIGGALGEFGNLISGNGINGVVIVDSRENTIIGNLVGTDASGTLSVGNLKKGIMIDNSPFNTIGGTSESERNVISGNVTYGIHIWDFLSCHNLVVGNYIGTDITGLKAVPNVRTGVLVNANWNTIGGSEPGARNVISGNIRNGVNLDATEPTEGVPVGWGNHNRVLGNLIGTDVTGLKPLGNGLQGVLIFQAHNNTIGGTSASERNVISDNALYGVHIHWEGAYENQVIGNYIGTDITGSVAMGNERDGVIIWDSPRNTIGGTTPGAGNVISGNEKHGVKISGTRGTATDNAVMGNLIGTDASRLNPVGNILGGVYFGGASANTVGGDSTAAGNVIAYNGGNGATMANASTDNAMLGNAIFDNDQIGIDLGTSGPAANDPGDEDDGANHLQNYPEFTSATKLPNGDIEITYKVDSSTGNSSYPLRVEFFLADSSGQAGEIFLGADTYLDGEATVDKTITFTPTVPIPVDGDIVATATDDDGNTSEFSASLGIGDPTSIIMVTSTADSGAGSLREAIELANATPGVDRIEFAIADEELTIRPLSPLPQIVDPIVIDGMSQPGFAGKPLIELDGSLAGTGVNGLVIASGNSAVLGLVINDWSGDAIVLSSVGNNRVSGNYLGTDIAGAAEQANAGSGIRIVNSANNVIGGAAASWRNVISGNGRFGVNIVGRNTTNNSVIGNLIGTDLSGTVAVGNALGGVLVFNAPANTIGGTAANVRNVISGNGVRGVIITRSNATDNQVTGNFIGTDIIGANAIGNAGVGVFIAHASGNTIGGATAGAGNVISGNDQYGLRISGINSTGNIALGNLIGSDVSGTSSLGNTLGGVLISNAPANSIGGAAANAGNVISGNDRYGVIILGAEATGNILVGNYVGTRPDGTTALGNASHGVLIWNADSNEIGGTDAALGNTIAFNGGNGVFVAGTSKNNSALGNAIFSNSGLGIDIGPAGLTDNDAGDTDKGANLLQNSPEIGAATKLANGDLEITYLVDSLVGSSEFPLRVEFFLVDAAGEEGKQFLGADTYVALGTKIATFTPAVPILSTVSIVATATDSDGNTSEFSVAVEIGGVV